MGSTRPWLETVEILQSKGIPLNLILHEANEYGKRRVLLPNAGGMARELAAQDSESPTKQNG